MRVKLDFSLDLEAEAGVVIARAKTAAGFAVRSMDQDEPGRSLAIGLLTDATTGGPI